MRLRRVIWNPWQAMGSLEAWRIKALKHFCHSKVEMQGGEAKRIQPWSILDDSHFSHFWSTSWSPIYACYMSFESLGSQQSNASNRVQFGAEMRKLQPLEDNCSKLKEGFRKVLRNHHFVARYFAAFLYSTMDFPWSFTPRWKPNTTRWKSTLWRCWINWLLWRNFAALLVHLRNFADLTCHLRSGPECFPIFVTDTWRYFSLDFCCLNAQILLVSHQW